MRSKKRKIIPASYRLPVDLLSDLRDVAGDEWGAQTAIVINALRKEVSALKRRRERKQEAVSAA
jgi:hypothetical protein